MSNQLDKVLRKVAPYMVAYGVARKMVLLKDATIDQRQENPETGRFEYKQVPLLYTQKACLTAMGGLLAIPLFPFYVYEDVKRCERLIRGIPDKQVPIFSKMTIDYLFI